MKFWMLLGKCLNLTRRILMSPNKYPVVEQFLKTVDISFPKCIHILHANIEAQRNTWDSHEIKEALKGIDEIYDNQDYYVKII